jgi:hypothetical protein
VVVELEFAEIEPLDRDKHDRASFSCGNAVYDKFLKEQANQEGKKNLSVCYVLTFAGQQEIIGYYTLSNLSLDLSSLPPETARKIGRYLSVPATLIGRLARSSKKEHQGMRLGSHLLVDACFRALELSKGSGSFAVFVDSESETIGFYERHNFVRLETVPNRLYLEMKQIEKLSAIQ